MQKIIKVLLAGSVLLSHYVFADADPVVAKYKGGEVTESQVFALVKDQIEANPSIKDKKFSSLNKQVQENIVRQYVIGKLIEQEAKSANLEGTQDYQTKLESAKKSLLSSEYLEQNIKKVVTDSAIETKSKEIKESLEGKDEIKISHILLDNEETAKNVKAQLDGKKTTFENLAKKYSKDQSSKNNGGKMGSYLRQGNLPKEFEDKAFSMQKGQISTPVKTDFGWHIIKLEDKRPIKVNMDEIKAQANQVLYQEAGNKLITDLTMKYNLEITLPKESAQPETSVENSAIKPESK